MVEINSNLSYMPKAAITKKKGERGQATLEFVLMFPLMFLLLLLVVDFGWLIKNWIVVTNSAREATRCAVVNTCDPVLLAEDRITSGITGNLDNTQVKTEFVDVDGDGIIRAGDSIVVCVSSDNHYISPLLQIFSFVTGGSLPDPLPIGAREEMRLEIQPLVSLSAEDGICST